MGSPSPTDPNFPFQSQLPWSKRAAIVDGGFNTGESFAYLTRKEGRGTTGGVLSAPARAARGEEGRLGGSARVPGATGRPSVKPPRHQGLKLSHPEGVMNGRRDSRGGRRHDDPRGPYRHTERRPQLQGTTGPTSRTRSHSPVPDGTRVAPPQSRLGQPQLTQTYPKPILTSASGGGRALYATNPLTRRRRRGPPNEGGDSGGRWGFVWRKS